MAYSYLRDLRRLLLVTVDRGDHKFLDFIGLALALHGDRAISGENHTGRGDGSGNERNNGSSRIKLKIARLRASTNKACITKQTIGHSGT